MEFLVLGCLLCLASSSLAAPAQQCSRSVRVVGPEWAVPGQPTAVLVTLLDLTRVANVTLRLVTSKRGPQQHVLASNTVTVHGDGIVGVSVPGEASGACWLETLVDCPPEDLCEPLGFSRLSLLGPVRDVIIRPTSNFYKPGETVEMWVLALDHDLRLAAEVTGNVYIRDPSGVRVAIWEDVPLDDGVKRFEFELSEWGEAGRWRLEVEAGGGLFWAELNVSLARGSKDPALPELPIPEEHYVELRFSAEMRRRYQPGLPFLGKIEAVSSEQAVRVRVKVLDNTTSIYSQDIDMSKGEETFLVPAILTDSPLITLQAELVSVGGKEIDSHYVLAKEPIYKWNSTSSCYLLVEGMENSLQPGEEAGATVLSSCPCDRELHYVITTEGHVTYWTEHQVQPQAGSSSRLNLDGTSVCRFNFKFMVEAVMAPVSHLLVYYVTDSGEPISDVISFDVKLLHKQVTLNVESRKLWYPMEAMDVQVLSEVGSLVCVMGGRGGDVHLHKTAPGMEVDFAEAGVSFFEPRCSGDDADEADSKPRAHHSVIPDAGLEQLWFWHCFNYTEEVEAKGLTVRAPEEPGKWALWALAVSPTVGLRYSTPLSVSVFRPVDVEFHLPHMLKVGESLEVDVKIGNNVNSCVDVNSLLTLSAGAHFVGSNQPYVAEKLRLGPHGATSLVVRVVPTTPGIKNFTVELTAFHSETCQSTTTEFKGNHSLVSSIVKQTRITIHPEGLKRVNTESAYFCANEQMVVSTPENFRYEFVSAPRNREGIVFEIRAGKGAYIALSDVGKITPRMYQVVIGDMDNTVTWVGKGKHGYSVHLQTSATPLILSSDEARTFWLSWERGVISVGQGPIMHNKPIIKWRMDKKMKVSFLGLATTWGQTAEFRIWNYNDEAGFSQVLHLDVPRSVLPGSEAGSLLISGGLTLPTALKKIMTPSLSEYSSLATVVASLAPLIIREFGNMNTTTKEEKKALEKDVGAGIQKLLSYRKKDGSFSDHHYLESHWSSLIVLEVLSKAQTVVMVDPDLVTGLKTWIQERQERDGSFSAGDADQSVDNSTGAGDLARTVETTALTLITLINVGLETNADSMIALKAKEYLETIVHQPFDGCTLSMLCYALASAKSDLVPIVINRLQNASTNEEGEFGWPRPRDDSDWLYEEGVEQKAKPPVTSNLRDFQASLYTLMTYTLLGDLKLAEPVARYLFYRSHLLDTHSELVFMSVKAFSQFGWLALDQHRKLTVSLATSGMELTDTLELRPNTNHQILSLPSLPTKVFVYATGAGCATVQGCVSYATYSPIRSNSVLEIWAGVTEEILPRRNSIQDLEGKLPLLNIKTCIKWKGADPSGVIRMEVHMFSGFELASVMPSELDLHFGSKGDRVWFTLANVSTSCAVCVNFWARSAFVVGRLRPALARAYPATRTDLAAEVFFHTSKGSPLLADITDDDLITWFGNTPQDDYGTVNSDFSDLCICGELCSENTITKPPITTEDSNETDVKQQEEAAINDFTDIIIFSDLHENFSTIQGSLEDLTDLSEGLESGTSEESTVTESETVADVLTERPTTVTTTIEEVPSSPTSFTDIVPNKFIYKATTRKPSSKQSLNRSEIPKVQSDINLEVPLDSIQNSNTAFTRSKHNSSIPQAHLQIENKNSSLNNPDMTESKKLEKPLIYISQKEKEFNQNTTTKKPLTHADSIIIQGMPDNTTQSYKSHLLNKAIQNTDIKSNNSAENEVSSDLNLITSANKAKAEREKFLISNKKDSLGILSEDHRWGQTTNSSGG